MKILIIGASGMLAKPVIEQLDAAGFQIRLFSRTVNPSMFQKEFEIVQGDVFNHTDLENAIEGCNAIHINLSKVHEALAVKAIVDIASQKQIKLMSFISGCSVSEENRWFKMIDNKYQAEQLIINSGISYMIFRPTWFFESLKLMVRNGKAMMLGKQPNPCHWVAARDYARMVVTAYSKQEAINKIFYVLGPKPYLMKDLLEKYCKNLYPEIKKINSVPVWLLKIIAKASRNKELYEVASMFAYFEKVKEPDQDNETNLLLGKPETTFEQWVQSKVL
jgi:uncharacterized protein YbjT (DUF2867 family)